MAADKTPPAQLFSFSAFENNVRTVTRSIIDQ